MPAFLKIFPLTLILAAASWAGPADRARDIVQQSGFAGGVVVHVNCGDGTLLEALCALKPNTFGHGLAPSNAEAETLRAALFDERLQGNISVSQWRGGKIPFVANFVNLLIVDGGLPVPQEEILRVLTPLGTAIAGDEVIKKPWPEGMDEWTQYLYDATGNAVSHDKLIKPPLYHLQWLGLPRYSRHHETMSSVSACVSGDGKIFYILDEGSTFSPMLPCHWKLIARDAFNGTVLWKRDIEEWTPNMQKLKSGPATLPRRLIVADKKVYVTLGIEAPVSVLDGATGETLRVLEGTEGTEEIIHDDGELYLVADTNPDKAELKEYPLLKQNTWSVREKHIIRYGLAEQRIEWNQAFPWVAPMTLAKYRNNVYFFDGAQVNALRRSDGTTAWKSEEMPVFKNMAMFFAPKLVVQGGRVMFSGGEGYVGHVGSRGNLFGLAMETGETVWKAPNPASGYQSPEDLLVIDGKAWSGDVTSHSWFGDERDATGEFMGINVGTGEVSKTFGDVSAYWFHHRCYMAKATEDYIITSRTGIEFIDPDTGEWTLHHWVRGACLFGILPANGMIYSPPNPCACYLGAKLYGFNSLVPKDPEHLTFKITPESERLETIKTAKLDEVPEAEPNEWPTYRADPARSGTTAAIDAPSALEWSLGLGGDLSPPVIAGGRVVVSLRDQHAVIAVDAASGEVAWRYFPGGRVDSPPTLYKNRVYFGATDGNVYCLDLEDGSLIWRYQGAPSVARHMYLEHLESTHPVHGNVLIMDDKLYTVAGRSMFLDGGIRFLILDAASGEKLGEQIMDDKVPGTDEELQMQHEILNMPVALSDVLSTNGKKIFMRYQEFDLEGNRLNIGHDRKLYGATKDEVDVANQPAMEQQKGEDAHVFSGTGFLDDTWWHRTYWIFGKINASGWLGHTRAGAAGTPAGRIMSFNEDNIFVWGRMQKYFKWTTKYEYLLRSQDHDFEQQWGVAVPILVRSMVLAGDEIYLLGPEEVTRQEPAFKTITAADTQEQMAEQEQALLGNSGSTLLRIDAKNGTILGGITLDSAPQFDGLAAAYDKLYVTMMDGTLRCFGESGGPLDTVTPGQVAEWNKAGVIPAKDKKKA